MSYHLGAEEQAPTPQPTVPAQPQLPAEPPKGLTNPYSFWGQILIGIVSSVGTAYLVTKLIDRRR